MSSILSCSLIVASVHQIRLFFIALQFFTCLSIPHWIGFDPAWLQQAARYFSAVGIVFSTIFGIYLTGAFHENGFADVSDGFAGGYTVPHILDIMKDSHVGAYGVIGITLMLCLKCTVLADLSFWSVIATLLIGHPVSRLMASVLIWRLSYVKTRGKAKLLAEKMSSTEWMIAAIFAVFPLLIASLFGWVSWKAIAAGLALSTIATLWMGRFFLKRIGGYTGGCLGAVQQVTEVSFYLSLLATTMAH